MKKHTMTEEIDKNLNEDDLEQVFSNIMAMEKIYLNECRDFLSAGGSNGKSNLHLMDLFVSAIVNRAISLNRGFLTLSKENNYLSSVPLIRLQLDNCLRLFAATIVDDYNDFFMRYLKGEHIAKITDHTGKQLTDINLVKRLEKDMFPGIFDLYKNTSGYIHFSNTHTFIQTKIVDNEKRVIGTNIGAYDFYKVHKKVDFTLNMYKVNEILLSFVKSWKDEKLRVESLIKSKED